MKSLLTYLSFGIVVGLLGAIIDSRAIEYRTRMILFIIVRPYVGRWENCAKTVLQETKNPTSQTR